MPRLLRPVPPPDVPLPWPDSAPAWGGGGTQPKLQHSPMTLLSPTPQHSASMGVNWDVKELLSSFCGFFVLFLLLFSPQLL